MRGPLALALAAAALLFGGSAQARTVSYGVAIGNNAPPAQSETPLPTLAFADDDAVRFWQLFGRFCEQSELLSVLDEPTRRRYPEALSAARPPSLAELRAVLSGLSRRMEADRARGDQPVLYLAFSGHGARGAGGAPFLAFADGALTREKLYDEILAPLPAAYVHLFIDACHAEGVVGARGAESDARVEPVSPQERQRFLEASTLERFPQVGVVLATAADQQAHEWSQIESGVFTHELLSGLSGAADVNGDGQVEYSELQAFLAATNRDVADPRAVPSVIAAAPRLNPHQPLISLAWQPQAAMLAGASRLGHFFVELESGQRYLDAHLSPEYLVRIAVPASRLFLVAQDREAEVSPRPGEIVRIERLHWKKRSVAARGAIESTLRRALFQSPYGPTYYRGWVDSAGASSVRWDPSLQLSIDTGGTRRAVAGAAFALGGAGLIAGVATGALAIQARRDFDRTSLQRPAAEARDRVVTFGTAASITGTVGLAALVAGFLVWPPSDEVVVGPALAPGQAGAVVAGRW